MKKFPQPLFLLILLSVAPAAFGQTDDIKIPEPEYVGNIVYINGGKAIPLEKQKASTKAKAGTSLYLTGIGKVKGSNVVSGLKSPVRIKRQEELQFIVRNTDNDVDPFQVINIFKLEQHQKKDFRFIQTSSSATFSGSSAMEIDFIPFVASKYGEDSYLISIQNNLDPGEYAITMDGSRDLFNMFGVD